MLTKPFPTIAEIMERTAYVCRIPRKTGRPLKPDSDCAGEPWRLAYRLRKREWARNNKQRKLLCAQ